MNGAVAVQAAAAKAAPNNSSALTSQRKCACGGAAGFTGECSDCQSQKFAGKRFQTKLRVNEPGDAYEQEADRVAEQALAAAPARHSVSGAVLRGQRLARQLTKQVAVDTAPATVVQAPASFGRPLKGAPRHDIEQQRFGHDFSRVRVLNSGMLQRKHAVIGAGASAREHAKSAGVSQPFSMPRIVNHALQSSAQPLDGATRARLEPAFGFDLGSVRIHAGATADRSARAIGALAYTVGRDIVFANGQYNPDTRPGLGVLAHELAHVVQQRGNTGTPQRVSMDAGAQSPAEQEAERARHAIEAGHPLPALTARPSASVQRLPGSPAGGCGLCYGQPNNVGLAAHPLIEAAFINEYPFLDITGEFQFPVIASPGDESGKLDLAHFEGFKEVFIGEIKPFNENGLADGQRDLRWYKEQLEAFGFRVKMLDIEPPAAAIPFPTLAPPNCPHIPPTHDLFVTPLASGLYGYWCQPDYAEFVRTCDCRTGRRKEPDPPVIAEPLTQPKGEPKSTSEPKGKGNGQPGKGDGRTPGRPGIRAPGPGGSQPTLRLPGGIDWDKVFSGLAALAALLALTPWGRLGAAIGTALGTFLRALGLTLGLGSVAAASPAAGSQGDTDDAPSGPSAGDPVPRNIPTPSPASPIDPSQGTTPSPGRTPRARPPSPTPSTKPPRRQTTVPTKKKRRAANAPAVKAPAQAQTIRMKLIEGVNLEAAVVGATFWVVNYRTKELVFVQVTRKESKGKDTTVDFMALVECSSDGQCGPSGKVYTVTHPYRPSDASAAVGGVVSGK